MAGYQTGLGFADESLAPAAGFEATHGSVAGKQGPRAVENLAEEVGGAPDGGIVKCCGSGGHVQAAYLGWWSPE